MNFYREKCRWFLLSLKKDLKRVGRVNGLLNMFLIKRGQVKTSRWSKPSKTIYVMLQHILWIWKKWYWYEMKCFLFWATTFQSQKLGFSSFWPIILPILTHNSRQKIRSFFMLFRKWNRKFEMIPLDSLKFSFLVFSSKWRKSQYFPLKRYNSEQCCRFVHFRAKKCTNSIFL